VDPGAEVTTTTTSNPSPSPSSGRRDPAAAGRYVGELFAEHGRMVVGLCRLLLRDPVEAEDAAQQVFLSAHHAVLRGSTPRDSAAWVAAITRNECRARIRARMREPLALPELPSDFPDPLVAAIRAADLDAVWDALSELPRRQRRALVLRELGGLSYHELGRALGVSHSAVESLLFRARQHVRSFVASANAAAVSVGLRDELARLIPGFDPAPVGVVARLAALPVAVKLATAAVGVGVATTGADGLHSNHIRPPQRQAAVMDSEPAPVVRERHARPAPIVALVRPTQSPVSHRESARVRHERRGRDEPERQEGAEVDEVEERETADSSGPGPAASEPLESESGHEGSGGGGGTEDHSGPGSSGSGSSSGSDASEDD
jgi:RNA polymerase sigma factor (sigma-70 family)